MVSERLSDFVGLEFACDSFSDMRSKDSSRLDLLFETESVCESLAAVDNLDAPSFLRLDGSASFSLRFSLTGFVFVRKLFLEVDLESLEADLELLKDSPIFLDPYPLPDFARLLPAEFSSLPVSASKSSANLCLSAGDALSPDTSNR